jgi:hypothetical protein
LIYVTQFRTHLIERGSKPLKMGYTRVLRYGDIIELYEYEKDRTCAKERHISTLAKNRAKKIRELSKSRKQYKRKHRSILRSVYSFFRLCHHNNCLASSIHFFTLTFAYDLTYKEAIRFVAEFLRRIKKQVKGAPFSYISTPELTKKGRFHFHILVYNLSPEITKNEFNPYAVYQSNLTPRATRNIQRQFQRGYVDIRVARDHSEKIAGYMAKYMAKALFDDRYEAERGYNCSRNIERTDAYGSNKIIQDLDSMKYHGFDPLILEPSLVLKEERAYDVPYLGRCIKKIYKTNI